MTIKNNIRNIGIVAHVDAGKTTLTEQLLYQSGSSRILGSVDKGTTHTDSLAMEKKRGISVKAAETDFTYKGTNVHVIDTPGHIDFSSEVERSIGVLDGAIVVLSSVEGVQPQTEVYFNALKELNTPSIFFINKLDRIGASSYKTIKDMKKLLTNKLIPLQLVYEENNEFIVKNIFDNVDFSKNILEIKDESFKQLLEDIIDILGNNNEEILNQFFGETLTLGMLKNEITLQANTGQVYPVLYGIALRGEGIKDLLNSIIDYLPGPENLDDLGLSALVYKISHNKTLGKIAHLKIFSGSISTRDDVLNVTTNKREKITMIKKVVNQKSIDVSSASSSDLVMVSGLNCSTYDVLGSKTHIPNLKTITTPLLTLRIYSKVQEDYVTLVEALTILQEEDPLLNMEWIKEKKEIHLRIMGKIQIEYIEDILMERFNVQVTFGSPSVIYRETPITSGYGESRYTMPKPCWAIVEFLIEPLPKGSGLIYESKVRTEKVKIKYQREIEDNIDKILSQGIYGWPVTDLKITFTNGEDHVMHSRSGDFATSSAMGIMRGLREIGTTLLEPIINFRITVPENVGGRVLNDIIKMRGSFETPFIHNGTFTIEGKMPVSTSLEYPSDLSKIASGKAIITTGFSGYEPCSLEIGATRERIGVNPLDRAKFILSVRNAL
ncbi:TetM/TetW/TetO/TetS family tetracycline resistance ribosomal protection protein [Clostridium estertheticum]|uniref:elongation factor G n=1 Tax=Clostridium estertheticum TaxID=238834 RepID=UPI001CF29527|nr:TetM/TetW/TetO/TetS family tetracycline resistance ribosomal protection protein [Clostridium estertheticum]MCB2308262.1 TetM/TetW/TetO/TetS family tetracycline resistance ribosomal protection protein [Clostridium estertheticum]MCB2346386.1 TetM/TetW/TetO/TetS family tetracycline resistance ribosomal protection protein [Clostridium estertheticum]MCB2350843.1 TetM/TetW/TetO/TetS family tetracycline resistance ribosomal protection protein [Clostridium estertheticum]WAG44842.1 TetM/TetW/TetO/Tet